MKLIIAGGRHYQLTDADFDWLDSLHAQYHFTHVISGQCSGADKGGEAWAKVRGIEVILVPAKWHDFTDPRSIVRRRRDGSRYNAMAGPIRNEQMAKIADACALFPGGNGTADMEQQAKAHFLLVFKRAT